MITVQVIPYMPKPLVMEPSWRPIILANDQVQGTHSHRLSVCMMSVTDIIHTMDLWIMVPVICCFIWPSKRQFSLTFLIQQAYIFEGNGAVLAPPHVSNVYNCYN